MKHGATVIAHIESMPVGNLGNQMLQWILLDSLRRRLGNVDIGGIELPLWHLSIPMTRPAEPRPLTFIGQYFDLPRVQDYIERGWLRSFRFAALGFRMAHYEAPGQYLAAFPR